MHELGRDYKHFNIDLKNMKKKHTQSNTAPKNQDNAKKNLFRAQKTKNYVLMLCLASFIILVYFATVIRLTNQG